VDANLVMLSLSKHTMFRAPKHSSTLLRVTNEVEVSLCIPNPPTCPLSII